MAIFLSAACYILLFFLTFQIVFLSLNLYPSLGTPTWQSPWQPLAPGFVSVSCCVCVSRSVVSDSLRPHRLQPTSLLHPWNLPGKSTGMGCHFLLHLCFIDRFICLIFQILHKCDFLWPFSVCFWQPCLSMRICRFIFLKIV